LVCHYLNRNPWDRHAGKSLALRAAAKRWVSQKAQPILRAVGDKKIKHCQCVGWAKRPGANASGGVPTISGEDVRFKKRVGTAQMRLCPPYVLQAIAQDVETNARRALPYRVWDFASRRSCSAWIIFSSQWARLRSSSRAIASAHFLKRGLTFALMAAERISDSGFFMPIS
jgi:hypothetical protein